VEGFHTKGWTKFFIVDFYCQNNIFNDLEWLHATCQLFDKNRAGDFVNSNPIDNDIVPDDEDIRVIRLRI
jgi:hypothetical protein